MAKDLLDDHFGRFRELPLELAKLGDEVTGICFSYRAREKGIMSDSDTASTRRVIWYSQNLGKLILPGLIEYLRSAYKLARELKPDLIWACSDSFHVILGVWLARSLKVKCVVDLYDNLEAFPATRFTGARPLFKAAVRRADGVTCFSKRLADHVIENYHPKGLTAVIENGVRKDLFYHQDRTNSRRALGLPPNAKIIGTAGALYHNRGIETLFRGFELLAAKDPTLHLAFAGPRESNIPVATGPKVHDLGILVWDQVALLINALDVAVSCYNDSELGRYSFPQKAYEILACKTPLVAAAVGSMNELLAAHPECLFQPGSPESLAKAIYSQLVKPTLINVSVPGWSETAHRLHAFFLALLETRERTNTA